jgi:hypothetical protein
VFEGIFGKLLENSTEVEDLAILDRAQCWGNKEKTVNDVNEKEDNEPQDKQKVTKFNHSSNQKTKTWLLQSNRRESTNTTHSRDQTQNNQ